MTGDGIQGGVPAEIIESADRRRRLWPVALVVAVLLASLRLLPQSHHPTSASPPVKVSSSPSATPAPQPSPEQASGAIQVGTRYLRVDPAGHRAYVQLELLPSPGPGTVVLIGSDVTESPVPMQLRLVDQATAASDLMAPLGSVFAAKPGPPGTLQLTTSRPAALEITIEPNCRLAPYPTYPQVSITYRSGHASGVFTVSPELPIITDWFDDAVAEACGGLPTPADVIAIRTVDGLRLTTVGPRTPGSDFSVQVTAVNAGTKPFIGAVGVMVFDRASGADQTNNAELGLSLIQKAFDPSLMSWSVVGAESGGVTPVGTGALQLRVRLAPGAVGHFMFRFSLGTARGVIGPLVGWVPAVQLAGAMLPDYADPGTFPQLVRRPIR